MKKATIGIVNKQVLTVFIFLFVIAVGFGLLYRQTHQTPPTPYRTDKMTNQRV